MSDEKRERFCDPSTAMEDQKLESQFESTADQLEQQLEITEEGKKQTASVMFSFLRSYLKKDIMPDLSRRVLMPTDEFFSANPLVQALLHCHLRRESSE